MFRILAYCGMNIFVHVFNLHKYHPSIYLTHITNKEFQHNNKSSQSNLGKVRRSHTTTQQSSLVSKGCPIFTTKTTPSLSTITPASNTPIPSTDPTYHHKRHLDPFSRFATVHFLDTLTDEPPPTHKD